MVGDVMRQDKIVQNSGEGGRWGGCCGGWLEGKYFHTFLFIETKLKVFVNCIFSLHFYKSELSILSIFLDVLDQFGT